MRDKHSAHGTEMMNQPLFDQTSLIAAFGKERSDQPNCHSQKQRNRTGRRMNKEQRPDDDKNHESGASQRAPSGPGADHAARPVRNPVARAFAALKNRRPTERTPESKGGNAQGGHSPPTTEGADEGE